MKRCTETDLLVEHCADCRTGKHQTSYDSKPRTVAVDPSPIRDNPMTRAWNAPTVVAEANYLLGAIDRLAESEWIDEAMVELRGVWTALTRAHGLTAGSVVGPCLTAACDGKVYRNRFTGFPECNVCRRIYEGLEALKIQLTEEAAR